MAENVGESVFHGTYGGREALAYFFGTTLAGKKSSRFPTVVSVKAPAPGYRIAVCDDDTGT